MANAFSSPNLAKEMLFWPAMSLSRAKQQQNLSRSCSILFLCLLTGWTDAYASTYAETQTALHSRDFSRILSLIKQDGGIRSETAAVFMYCAARDGEQDILEKLLAEGVPPDHLPAGTGETALMQAVTARRQEMVSFLLKKGAKAGYVGHCREAQCTGHTALFGAVMAGDVEITKALLEAGADPNNLNGCIMYKADTKPDLEIYELLLNHGGRQSSSNSTNRATNSNVQSPATPTLQGLGLAELLPTASSEPPLQPPEQCRLAIIADPSNVAAADLLVARLSTVKGIELVERQELDRILAEQKLTRDFASASANYSRVAVLLRANALLLIRSRALGQAQAIEARFVRVHPGIVLDTVYRATPLADVEAWVKDMSRRVMLLAARSVRKDAIAVSLLECHASIQTSATRALERTLTVLLRDRLVHDPRFVMLERADMEKVAAENASEKPFWTGSYLVDPAVEPALNGSGNFTLILNLRPSGRGNVLTAKASSDQAKPAVAIDAIMQNLNGQLGGSTVPPARDLAVEANEYLTESHWAMAAEMPVRAHAAAEIAWALGLQNSEVARLRVSSAMQAVRELCSHMNEPNPPLTSEWLEVATLGTAVWKEFFNSDYMRQHPNELRAWVELAPEVRDGAMLAFIAIDRASEQRRQAEKLEKLRQIFWEALGEAWLQSNKLPGNASLVKTLTQIQAATARLMLRNTGELMPVLREIFSRHFATNDNLTRAELRTAFSWDGARVMVQASKNFSGSRVLALPQNKAARKQLLDMLYSSKAPEDHFLAATLEVTVNISSVMERFWGMRDLLAQDGKAFDVYYRRFFDLTGNETPGEKPRLYAVRLLNAGQPATVAELNCFEYTRRLYIYLLDHAPKYEPAFDQLLRASRHTAEEIAEVAAAHARYRSRTGAPPLSAPTPARYVTAAPEIRYQPGPPPADTGAEVQVRQFWHPFGLALRIPPEFRFQGSSMTWYEGRLWAYGYVEDFYATPNVTRRYLFAIDLQPGRTESFELPVTPHGGGVDAQFVLTPSNVVLAAVNNFLAVGDRATGRWQMYPEIKPASPLARPVIEGDSAYLIVESGAAMLRFDLKQRTTEILASTRRKPEASPLDDPTLVLGQIGKNDLGEIGLVGTSPWTNGSAKKVAYMWSPMRREWHSVPMAPRKPGISTPPEFLGMKSDETELAMIGRARVRSRGGKTGLSLRYFNPAGAGPRPEVPLNFIPPSSPLPENQRGPQKIIDFDIPCRVCPAGYLFPVSSGPGFWFLPKKDLDVFVAQGSDGKTQRNTNVSLVR